MHGSRFRQGIPGAIALALLLAGCGGPKSSSTSGPSGGPMPTDRITMNLRVESAEPGKAVVRANLNDGKLFSTSYRLDGGDYLRACMSGLCRSMADNDSIYTPDYIARFDYQPGVDYVVSFNRVQGSAAPDSRVALPPSFTIVTPASRQQVTNGDTVIVSWAPTGAPARVYLDYQAECTFLSGAKALSTGTLAEDSNADGQESVSIDPIVTFAQSGVASTLTRCSIDVHVNHELQGRVDPAFHKGIALGIVSRTVNLDYVPH
jgi:hypothetical protein